VLASARMTDEPPERTEEGSSDQLTFGTVDGKRFPLTVAAGEGRDVLAQFTQGPAQWIQVDKYGDEDQQWIQKGHVVWIALRSSKRVRYSSRP
jgi:hypothetical protein